VSLVAFARLIRADTLGPSITMVLLGAATAATQIDLGEVPGLVAVAVSFHLFAYLLNDVVDLPIDRTDPRRAATPLVLGTISPRLALLLAFVQIPIAALLVIVMGGDVSGLVTLTVLCAAIVVYDLWGKRCPLPPLTDAVQGLAWAALGWLAADLVGVPTAWTLVLAAYFLVFIMLANGVHGSIRDLVNDRRHGARTTAIWFAAESRPGGAVRLSRAYLAYAFTLQAATVTLPFVPTALGWDQPTNWLRVAGMCLAGATSTVVLVFATRAGDRHRQLVLGAWHLILVLAALFLMLGPRLPGWGLAIMIACYVLPFASYRWLWRRRPEAGSHWTAESASTG
jgi:4-hydroxybenzoate polyprenyltransferase